MRSSRSVIAGSVVGIAVGAAGLAVAFRAAPREGWTWLLVHFVLSAGIATGATVWTAAFRVAQTRWTSAVNRLGHSAAGFLPVLVAVLVILLVGAKNYVPWVAHPVPEKSAWLNVPFMVAREAVCFGVLCVLILLMVRWSLRADAGAARGEPVSDRDQFRLTAVGTAIVMFYAIAGSIMAFDLVMSLSPMWISTMFAPYFWITNMYGGMAALILMSAALRGPLGVERRLQPQQFQDMGNLLLGFSLFSMGLFFAQYLTIWYGNLPIEAPFIVLRYVRGPWAYPGWAAFVVGYGIPFILLQSRRLKRDPRLVSPVAVLALIGVALERYVLIVPSIEPRELMIHPAGALGALAFVGAFVVAVVAFLVRYPPVSAADEALREVKPVLEIAQ